MIDNVAQGSTVRSWAHTAEQTREIVAFVTETAASAIPDDVLHASKRCVLDFLGVAIAASDQPAVTTARATFEQLGGQPQATAIGSELRLRCTDAAAVNGVAGHAFDFDDTHVPTILHPTTPLLAAGFAVAEWQGRTGSDLLAAHALGYELGARTALAMHPGHYDRGWHVTGTAGTLAAAGVAARLLGLTGERALASLGVAATQASGHREHFGTMTKPFHAGHAASGGVLAALLAARGFSAAPDPLQGRRGMFAVMSGSGSADELVDGLGTRWEIFRNGVKPYACGVVAHPAIDAVHRLRTEAGVRADEVDEIEISVHPLVVELTGHREPRTGLEGKFSVAFACAIVLLDGSASEHDFSDANVRRPDVQDLMRRIRATPTDGTAQTAATARLRDRTGGTHSIEVRHARGTPDNPLDDAGIAEKFHALVDDVLTRERADALERRVWAIEGEDRLADLLRLASVHP